jgi:hypothetical protein
VRVYLPISHQSLTDFLASKSFEVDLLFAPTPQFLIENDDCDEEESEYLLSVAAGEKALELATNKTSPGLVLALDITVAQIGEMYEDSITLRSAVTWDQVQCALLAWPDDDELVWFATQEIEIHIGEWK